MSYSKSFNFVAGAEDLGLHELLGFTNTFDGAADNLPPPSEDLTPPRLASPFAGPLEDLQSQPAGWLSPPTAGSVDGLDAVNFDDFLALDEGTDDLPAAAKETPSSPSPEMASSRTRQEGLAPAADDVEDVPTAPKLEAAQAEIAQLKAALTAESLQHKFLTTPGGGQISSSPRKRKSPGDQVSPPKRQITTQIGPIEAMWSPKITEDERRAFQENIDSPTTPKTFPAHLEFAPQTTAPYISSPGPFEISPEDLHSIQDFLNSNPALIHGPSHHVDPSISPSNINMTPHPVNMKAERAPLKRDPRPSLKTTPSNTSKVTKKTKATEKKTQHRRNSSTTSITSLSPAVPNRHRSIDQLLAANFYSLNEQEKCRILLPMLRNLDPRELEASLAELPCIQAKGPGHEVRVARAIHDSPPTPEADAVLATKLTTGAPPSPTPVSKTTTPPTTSSSALALRASPSPQKTAKVEASVEHGAVRQREALEKAALLQA